MSRLRFLIPIAIVHALASTCFAQDTTHLFPQIADGILPDGTYYRSTLNVTSWIAEADCVVRLEGLSAELDAAAVDSGVGVANLGPGTTSLFSMRIPEDGFVDVSTTGVGTFVSGYGVLTCDAATYAHLTYSAYSQDGQKIGEATVFSSRPSFRQRLTVDRRDAASLGIAIVNDTDLGRSYNLTLFDASGQSVATGATQVGGRSVGVAFAHDLIGLPAGEAFLLQIQSVDFSDLSAIGLRFTGPLFSTVPAR